MFEFVWPNLFILIRRPPKESHTWLLREPMDVNISQAGATNTSRQLTKGLLKALKLCCKILPTQNTGHATSREKRSPPMTAMVHKMTTIVFFRIIILPKKFNRIQSNKGTK